MAYTVMAYIVMALYVVMASRVDERQEATYSYGLYSYGLYSYGPVCSYGLQSRRESDKTTKPRCRWPAQFRVHTRFGRKFR